MAFLFPTQKLRFNFPLAASFEDKNIGARGRAPGRYVARALRACGFVKPWFYCVLRQDIALPVRPCARARGNVKPCFNVVMHWGITSPVRPCMRVCEFIFGRFPTLG